ncbi:hypothetical protein QBC45DRAFT_316813 [Copromyces sp. CBS 386.78]|nr:hypothetical protein QBC45DRAFT_316813 [Copromyces sp. CBS 386.78]
MPSFVPDENSPIYQRSPAVVHLQPAGQYGQPNGKVDDHPLPRHSHSHTSIESFDDEGSSQSTHTSTDDSDIRTRLNGDSQRRHPNMASSPNGGLDGDVDGINGKLDWMNLNGTNRADGSDRPARHDIMKSGKPHPNGRFPIAIPDRTVPLSNSARSTPDGQTTHDQKGAFSRASLGSANSGSIHPSPTEMSLRPINRGDVRTVENGTATPPALQTTPNGYPFPSSPPAQQRDLAPNSPPSPHRYSSPPLYNPAAPISASTSALAPPPAPGIKQRHTLDVPKPSAPRGSKDGSDGAYTTGRFSPTGVAGVRRASLNLARRNTRSLHSEMPRDEVVPDDDALRWAEVYREKRASKRRRRDAEDDDRVLVGTKVDETHANWVTAYNMLTGIRVSVSRTNAKLDRPLTDADFEAKQKSTFDIAGNEMIPSAKYDFKFKDYAPWVFRHLRARFQLDPADYLMSLTGKYILSELGSPGKSGSFFYFSRDYKYIIKTIHHAEHKFLRKILKDYYKHVTENPNTLLSQFYGLHRVKIPYGKKIHFVVMNNLFPPHRDIHQTFDLKGSTIGRDYKEEDLDKNPRATLKDLNWIRRHRHLELGLQKKKMFLEQLQKDVRLLQKLQIMDYSLLVGIHDLQRGNEENLRDKTLKVFNPGGDNSREDPSSVLMRTPSKLENARKARELRQMVKTERPVPMGETSSRMPDELEHNQSRASFVFNQDDGGFRATHEDNTPADEIYYLGVIDCLTHYGIIKKLENFWKGKLSGDRKNSKQISALPPQEYGERFINFISGITMSCEEAIREAQERDREMQAEAALADQKQQRVGSWSSARNGRSSTTAPPLPSHQSPPLPSGVQSPETEATMQRAEREAYKTGVSEEDIPSKTLRTTLSPGSIERRDNIASQASILPVVEEAAEGRSSSEHYVRNSRVSNLSGDSEYRPLTPAKDGEEKQAGFGNPLLRGHARDHRDHGPPPPTPPKTGYGYGTPQSLKDGADSGYSIGFMNGNGKSVDLKSSSGSLRSNKGGHQIIGRESLDKALPPLPSGNAQARPQGVS